MTHAGDAATADAPFQRRELVERAMKVQHGHGPPRRNGGQCQRPGHWRNRGHAIGQLCCHAIGHHRPVTHARCMDATLVNGQTASHCVEQFSHKLNVLRLVGQGLTAAIAAVPREHALARASARRIDNNRPPVGCQLIQTGKPPHQLGMGLAAVKCQHDRPTRCGRLDNWHHHHSRSAARPHRHVDDKRCESLHMHWKNKPGTQVFSAQVTLLATGK